MAVLAHPDDESLAMGGYWPNMRPRASEPIWLWLLVMSGAGLVRPTRIPGRKRWGGSAKPNCGPRPGCWGCNEQVSQAVMCHRSQLPDYQKLKTLPDEAKTELTSINL